MSPKEVGLRIEKKWYQRADAKGPPDFSGLDLCSSRQFPKLPPRESAPEQLRAALRRDCEDILSGRWKAFGHLPLRVDDPPKWQFDYLAGKDFQSSKNAFELDHRAQPGGADIKVIWEPSRWYPLVRLAMAAWLLGEERAQRKCVEWLLHWARTNRPFTGLNWTSGLETGMRLVQFTWIDAFLEASGVPAKELAELRQQILPPHAWYTWRYRSFGSSANNHLLGELAGIILAVARWPGLASIAAPLQVIKGHFEREVLAQFTSDGGNQEQALGYHLFSWEFCWQTSRALKEAGLACSPLVEDRLVKAGQFYAAIKPKADPWDFGDSDNAFVTPFFLDETQAAQEWHAWFEKSGSSPAIRFWWGDFPAKVKLRNQTEWQLFPESGYAVLKSGDWCLRLDASPLGYLSMAPHGHLDALHLSVWFKREPLIIDPGTGAYYADKTLRDYLADWTAHNGPHIEGDDFPKRRGTFLWGSHHPVPRLCLISGTVLEAEMKKAGGTVRRQIEFLPGENAVLIKDTATAPKAMLTYWKFGPGIQLEPAGDATIRARAREFHAFLSITGWSQVEFWDPPADLRGKIGRTSGDFPRVPMDRLVSPAFRSVQVAPTWKLRSNGSAAELNIKIAIS